MTALSKDIAAFDKIRAKLEAQHHGEWVVFHNGDYIDVFPDFEHAAEAAVGRFNEGPYLIRQVGAGPIQLPSAMIFRPAHANDSSGV